MTTTHEVLRGKFIDMFFKGVSLQRIMTHFSNTCSSTYMDPVTTTVTMMLKNPVQCAINEQGICPFKAHPTMTFPFSLMTAEQHRFVNNIQLAENRTVVSVHSLMVPPQPHDTHPSRLCSQTYRTSVGLVTRRGVAGFAPARVITWPVWYCRGAGG
jgi:hypothetical protein